MKNRYVSADGVITYEYRTNGPSVIYCTGFVIWKNKNKVWHRNKGPATSRDVYQRWYKNGKLIRDV